MAAIDVFRPNSFSVSRNMPKLPWQGRSAPRNIKMSVGVVELLESQGKSKEHWKEK